MTTIPQLKVRVYWGDILYDTVLCEPKKPVTVGRSPGSTLIIDLGRQSPFTQLNLVNVEPSGKARIQFHEGTEGYIRFDGKLLPLSVGKKEQKLTKSTEGLYTVELGQNDRAELVIGHVSFDLSWARTHKLIPRLWLNDKRKAAVLSGLIVFALLLISVLSLPYEKIEPEKPPERLVQILSPKAQRAKAAMGDRLTADGGAQIGPSGKADTSSQKPTVSAAEQLRNANLGNLVSNLSSVKSKAIGPSGPKTPGTSAAINQVGTGGFTTEGLGQGAGGKSVGIGRTVGQGQGGFEGTGKLGLSGNSLVEGGTGHGTQGPVTEGGGLDRAVIDQVVRRRQDRIRLCYERQLNFNPKLSGKVTVGFAIGASGAVNSANIIEDTMKNESVRSCIIAEVKTWTFPRPSGGTLVKVDYPFVFESGGVR